MIVNCFEVLEYNINGTIIEMLKHESLPNWAFASDIVYWNDADIPNTTGTSGQFGDNESID